MKTSKVIRTLVAVVIGFAWAAWASAGLYVEQQVTSSGKGQPMQMSVRAWADSSNLRVEYLESNNAILPKGSYLLTRDAGQTVYLIRPQEKTYSVFSLSQVFSTFSQMREMSGGMVNIDFRDPISESLEEGPGGTLLGRSTTHRSWRTGFTMDMKMAFLDQSNRMETVTNAWIAKDLSDPVLRIWFSALPRTTGDPELDEVLLAGAENIDGMVLKLEQQTTVTNQKGGGQSSSSTVMEVTELREETPDSALFEMPVGYTETPLIPALAGMEGQEDEGAMKALQGMFGRKKDKKKNN